MLLNLRSLIWFSTCLMMTVLSRILETCRMIRLNHIFVGFTPVPWRITPVPWRFTPVPWRFTPIRERSTPVRWSFTPCGTSKIIYFDSKPNNFTLRATANWTCSNSFFRNLTYSFHIAYRNTVVCRNRTDLARRKRDSKVCIHDAAAAAAGTLSQSKALRCTSETDHTRVRGYTSWNRPIYSFNKDIFIHWTVIYLFIYTNISLFSSHHTV